MELDFDNLPARSDAEQIIQSFDADTVLSYINFMRQRQLTMPEAVSEEENVIGLMLVRHLRTLRESKSRTKAKAKNTITTAPLADLF